MIKRLEEWIWMYFVIHKNWLGFCSTCDRYSLKRYINYNECKECYRVA